MNIDKIYDLAVDLEGTGRDVQILIEDEKSFTLEDVKGLIWDLNNYIEEFEKATREADRNEWLV